MVREWDPRTASSAELESLLDTVNAVLTVDLPGDPLWRNSSLREYLVEVMPGERRISWLAEEESADGRTRVLGHVSVLLLGDIGVVELQVHPDARRRGLGRLLLAKAARRTWQEGFSSISVEVVGDTPAVAFFESLGFTREYVETRSVLRLSGVDWDRTEALADGPDPGYQLEFWPGGPPERLIDAYTLAKAEARAVDDGDDRDTRSSSYDPQRLRDSLDCLHRRGMKPYIVLAVHRPTGTVAGLTEVVVPAQHPTRADQYDTIVGRAHSGRGLERALKARMLTELRVAEPDLAEVQTWNAQANDPMLAVNIELGFAPDRLWCEYAIDVAPLVHRLDGTG